MDIIELPISELKPYKNNAKIHNKKQIELLAKSLNEFKWQQPLVIDRDKTIIAGHGRYEAAKQLGLKTAPVKYADELTEDQIKAYRLIDNRSTSLEYDLSKAQVNDIKEKRFAERAERPDYELGNPFNERGRAKRVYRPRKSQ